MKLAIFDIDGTIFRSSLVIELCSALVKLGVFPKASQKEIQTEHLAWLNRQGSYEAYINKVVKIYLKYIRGKDFVRINRAAKEVISLQKNRVYRFTRDLIKKLKRQNYFLVAISGSPSYMVESYAKAIGFNKFFGTELEVKNSKFTGRARNLDSAFHKSKIVKSLMSEYKNINLKLSVAVGDTESDIAMLSLVGRPVAFNPNLKLAKHAKQKQWEIIVERKDVTYKISNFKFLISKI